MLKSDPIEVSLRQLVSPKQTCNIFAKLGSFRNGIDGLLQLSSVYTANVEMFGNTLFYPGMDLWINPYGFGGLHLGRPQQGD